MASLQINQLNLVKRAVPNLVLSPSGKHVLNKIKHLRDAWVR